jgi:uncharacterized membrane protein HdeD (DUF308 family)
LHNNILIEEIKKMTADAMTLETKQTPWWVILMGGILNIIVGGLLLTAPAKTTFLLVVVLGIYWIISGIFTLVAMFIDHSAWGWKLFMGMLSILAGLVILRYPIISTLTIPSILILLLGIQGVIVGIVSLIMAFRGGGWGAGILGVLSIIFGLILIANFSAPGMILTLIWVVAIFALIGGILQIFQAFRQRVE